jgi:hypothetical protein
MNLREARMAVDRSSEKIRFQTKWLGGLTGVTVIAGGLIAQLRPARISVDYALCPMR